MNPASAAIGFLPDDVGLAIFSTAAALPANRLDSVGYSSVTAVSYFEGTGLSPAAGITAAGQHSWVRRLTFGTPQDTNNNAADFVLVETSAIVTAWFNHRRAGDGAGTTPPPTRPRERQSRNAGSRGVIETAGGTERRAEPRLRHHGDQRCDGSSNCRGHQHPAGPVACVPLVEIHHDHVGGHALGRTTFARESRRRPSRSRTRQRDCPARTVADRRRAAQRRGFNSTLRGIITAARWYGASTSSSSNWSSAAGRFGRRE